MHWRAHREKGQELYADSWKVDFGVQFCSSPSTLSQSLIPYPALCDKTLLLLILDVFPDIL